MKKSTQTSVFTYTGAIIILMTAIVVASTDIFPEYMRCQTVMPYLENPEVTNPDVYDVAVARLLKCSSVQTDLYMSYLFVALGFAMLVAGFILSNEGKEEEKIKNKRIRKKR